MKDVEVMPVLSPEATVEIIGENTSAPVRLLYSPGGLVSKALTRHSFFEALAIPCISLYPD